MNLRRLAAKLFNFFRGGRAEQELDREIASHLRLLEDEFVRRGLSLDDARLAARRAYGGVEQAKELHRDERSIVWLEQAWQDLRHAARGLARSPGFSLVAIITLALGIGVNTTLFTAFNAVALKPLPVADPNQVVRIKRWFQSGSRGDNQYAFSYPEYLHFRDHSSSFDALVAASWPVTILATARDSSVSEKLEGELVSANYFAAMGTGARLGRTFQSDEDRTPGANPALVLSHSFWLRRFQGNSQILGESIRINDTLFTIVGIASEAFTGTSVFPRVPDFWTPLSMQAQLAPGRDWRFQLLGRLKPSATLKRAQAETDALLGQFAATHPERDKTKSVTVERTAYFGNTDDIRFQALVAALMLIVGMVLLVACANLANMLLARGAARQREIAIRLALGATRWRVIRHLLSESVLLSLAGGVAGLIVSLWTSRLLWVAIEQMLTGGIVGAVVFKMDLSPDARVFGYVLALSIATGILFGLSPALRFTVLGQRVRHSRLRSLLVGTQVAVAMLLLVSAGLLTRGLLRSQAADPGFETRRTLLLFGDFRTPSRQRKLLERLKDVPELRSVALGGVPMRGTWTPPIVVEGARGRTLASYASEAYFETLGIPLMRGRAFTREESEQGRRIAVISESTARRFWPQDDAIGKRFKLDMDFNGKLTEFEVIGVAKDVRFANLTRVDPMHVYLPTKAADIEGMLLRAHGDSQSAVAAVRAAAGEFDKDLLPGVFLTSIAEGPLLLQKSMAQAFAMFGAILASLALALAGVGIYGVMSYLMSQRVREIGVRMALGATPGGVLKTVVLQSLRPVGLGVAFGLAGAAALSWALHKTLVFPGSADVLYGVPFYDPVTFLGLTFFVAGVAAIASAVPARRALRVDPMVALRYE